MNQASIKLQGGLGNYLFQIAFLYNYSLENNKKIILDSTNSIKVHNHIESYKENILFNLDFKSNIINDKFNIYNELEFKYNKVPNMDGNIYFNGYFQSEKYFKNNKKEILELFSFPKEVIENVKNKYLDILKYNTCSIHVRRGDYLKYPNSHPIQTIEYYQNSISFFSEKNKFLIFSDDIEWCKDNFPNEPDKFKFIEGNKDYEDLLLMSLCNNNIICNSTFSWWAAWLNKNENKIVIAPKLWFGDSYKNHDTSDLYCENWIKI